MEVSFHEWKINYLDFGAAGAEEAATAASSFAFLPPCLRQVRVGANSPRRWPIICSVTNTGVCWRPLWTPKVWPTKSGEITQLRLQVLIGFFCPTASSAATFFATRGSTNGPLDDDLVIEN